MNKVYKVKFNKSLGVYQVASELANNSVSSKIVDKSNLRKNNYKITVSLFMFSLLSSNISNAVSDTGIVVNGSNTNVITSSTSGANVINIAKPSDNGLSHNKYSEFNVNNPGVVFNNSNVDTKTNVVGNIKGNENLQGSNAKIILNEINGINSSNLKGTLEVAGKKASIIIANQNGIIVDGIATINADALTLTTGKVDDIKNLGFDVMQGNVVISGSGVNTSGLSKFDIITKTAQINATVGEKTSTGINAGNTDISIISGRNLVKYGTNKIVANTEMIAPHVNENVGIEIGGDVLGSIYGNNIILVSTDSGAGVRQKGLISSPNDINITSEGNVSLNNIYGSKLSVLSESGVSINNANLTKLIDIKNNTNLVEIDNVKSGELNVVNESDISIANVKSNDINISSDGGIFVGKSSSNTNYSVDSKNFNIKKSTSTYIEGSVNSNDLDIISNNLIINNANVNANNKANINISDNVILTGKFTVEDFDGNVIDNATAYADNDNYGLIVAVDKDGKVIDNVTVVSKSGVTTGDLIINVGNQLSNNNGNLVSENTSLINVGSLLNDGIISSKDKINITAKDSITNNFLIQGSDINVKSNSVKNNATVNVDNGSVKFDLKNELVNTGSILAEKLDFQGNGSAKLENSRGLISSVLLNIEADKIINDNNSIIRISQPSDKYQGKVNTINANSIFYDKNSVISSSTLGIDIKTKDVTYGGNDSINQDNISMIDLSSSKFSNLYSDSDLTLSGVQIYLSETNLDVKNDVYIKNSSNVSYKQFFKGKANNFNIEDSLVGANYYRGRDSISEVPNQILKDENNGLFELDLVSNYDSNKGTLLTSNGTISANKINNDGYILGFNLDLNAKNFSNTDRINSWKDIVINAINIENISNSSGKKASVKAGNNIYLIGDDFKNRGVIYSDNIISADLTNSTNNYLDAIMQATNKVLLISSVISNEGYILSNSIGIKGDSLHNVETGSIEGESKVLINAKKTVNAGKVLSDSVSVNSNTLDNTKKGSIEGQSEVLIDSISTDNHGRILSDYVKIKGVTVENRVDSTIKAKNIDIELDHVKGIFSNNGYIASTEDVNITTNKYLNTNLIMANKNSTINIKNNDLNINEFSKTAYGNENLNYNIDRNMYVNDDIINVGNIIINSQELTNNELIFSVKNTSISTNIFINEFDAYLGADNNVIINSGSVANKENATIIANNTVNIFSTNFANFIGKIKGVKAVNIITEKFLNEGKLTSNITEYDTGKINYYKELPHSGGGSFSFTFSNINYKLPNASQLKVKQGVIESEQDINLRISESGVNRGVIAAIKGDLNIIKKGEKDVTFSNESLYENYSIYSLLTTSDYPLTMRVYRNRVLSGDKTITYNNIYELFDDVFGNQNKKTQYGFFNYINTDVIKVLQDNGFVNAIDSDPNGVLKNAMSIIFGAEWHVLGSDELHNRWNQFVKNKDDQKYNFKVVSQINTALVAGNNHNFDGVNFTNGDPGVSKRLIKDDFDERDIKIGNDNVTSLDGQFSDLTNKDIINTIDDYDFDKFSEGWLPNIDGLFENNKLVFKTEVKNKYNYKDIFFKPTDVSSASTHGYDKGILVSYLYETKIPFNDSDYYGSNYYFNTLGVVIDSQNKNPIYSIGDGYFESNLIADQYRALSSVIGYSLTPAEIAKNLIDNSKSEMDKQGLIVGQPLTVAQISNLSSDIVWYEWAGTANDGYILTPRVYISEKSSKANQALGAGAYVVAGNDVNIKSDDGSFVNSNGSIIGNNVNIDVGNEGFVYTGAKASNGESISANNIDIKSGDVYIKGAGIIAGNIDIDATKDVNIQTGMQYVNGNLVNATENVLASASDGYISIKGENITLIGAGVDAGNGSISLEAGNNITLKDVHEVTSSKDIQTTSNAFSWGHTITDISSATSSGSTLNSSDLNIKSGKDLKVVGGSINADNSQIDVGGDFTAEAGENLEHYYQETSFTGLFSSVSGNMAYNNNKPEDYNKQISTSITPNSYAVNAPGTGSVGFGFSHSETKETIDSLTHNNAQLNFGNGEINVEKKFDFGGADINANYKPEGESDLSDAPTLTVNAGDIQTTKVEDKIKRDYNESSWSVGFKVTAESNVAKLATDLINMDNQDKISRGTDDTGMKTGVLVTDIAGLVLGDAAAVNVRFGFDKSKNNSSSTTYTENKNNVSGNINFNSKKDVTLNNVDILNSDNVNVNAKENVNINAGKSRFTEESDTSTVSVGADFRVSAGLTGSGGSLSVGASRTKGSNNKEGANYSNSNVSANNINIISGNDLNIKGGVIGNDDSNVTVDSGGDVNIESIQDTINGDGQTTTVGASLGATMGVGTKGGVPTPLGVNAGVTGGVGVSVSKQHTDVKDVNQQSGIQGNNVVIIGNKDLNLTGGFIEANNGRVHIEGDVNAREINDTIIDTDKTGTGGAMIGGRPGIGNTSPGLGGGVSGGYGQGNNTDREETNHATISMGNGSVNVGGTTNGKINTDKDEKVTVEKDIYTGAYQFEAATPIPGPKKKTDKEKTATEYESSGSVSIDKKTNTNRNEETFSGFEKSKKTLVSEIITNRDKLTSSDEKITTTSSNMPSSDKPLPNTPPRYNAIYANSKVANKGIRDAFDAVNSSDKQKIPKTIKVSVDGKVITLDNKSPAELAEAINKNGGIVTGSKDLENTYVLTKVKITTDSSGNKIYTFKDVPYKGNPNDVNGKLGSLIKKSNRVSVTKNINNDL